MGRVEMGDGLGPQSGVQVLPAYGEGQKTACGGRVAMEADGGGCGERDVARRRGELRCDGGGPENGMRTWSGSCGLTSSWKKKSSGKMAWQRTKLITRRCARLGIPRLFASTHVLRG